MRIAILTQPLRYNYGGILQNFALQTVLRRMGHKVETLDPCRYFAFHWWQYLLFAARHLAANLLKGYDIPLRKEYNIDSKKRKLGRYTFPFIDKHIRYRGYKNLHNDIRPTDYDVYIVGSDQVWRGLYNTNLTNMFLDFTEGWSVKRLAYAASFGTNQWEGTPEETEKCKSLLQQFDMVTVREDTGVDLCKNIFDVEAIQVLDPTLLLTQEDYIRELQLNLVPKSQGNLLVYILDYDEGKQKMVDVIAEAKHLTPFRVNSDYENLKAPVEKRVQPPIEQWVCGFYDAEYVVTDSFHACAFAIIFNKPFTVCLNSERGSARFESLFKFLGIVPEKICHNIFACSLPDRGRIQGMRETILQMIDKELGS